MNLAVIRLLGRCHFTERPVRTLITILGVALGVSVSVAIRAANVEVLRSFESAVASIAGRATLQVSGGDLGFDERVIVSLRRHPDVIVATPILTFGVVKASGTQAKQGFKLVALDLLEASELKNFRVHSDEEGTQMLERLLSPTAVFLGAGLAEEWSLSIGDPLEILLGIHRHALIVQGIVEGTADLSSTWNNMAIMDIAAAQNLFGLVGRLDRIDLETRPGRPVQDIAKELRSKLPPGLKMERPSQRSQQLERMVGAFQLNLGALSMVGLLVGLLLVYNTVSYAVVQRRREIGLYRAIGMARGVVTTLFVTEASLMGLAGGVGGGWLGVLLARHLVSVLRGSVSELYTPLPDGGGSLDPHLSSLLLGSGVLGMAVSIVGAIGPSLEASRTDPARALAPGQYDEIQQIRAGRLAWVGVGGVGGAILLAVPGPVHGMPLFGYASAFFLLLSPSFLAPSLLVGLGALFRLDWSTPNSGTVGASLRRLAADQVARTPGRNAVTVSALMVGVAIMLGVGIMIQSFRETVEHWIDQTIVADLIVAPAGWPLGVDENSQAQGIPLSLADDIARIEGVGAVDTYRTIRLNVQDRPVSLVARDLRVHSEWSRYLFIEGDSPDILNETVKNEGVLLSEVLARALGINRGDTLSLTSPAGPVSFPVTGVFYDYATDGGKAVLDRELYRKLWKDETTTVIPVYVDVESDPKLVRTRIQEGVGGEHYLVVIANHEIRSEILAIFDRTFTVTYALELIAIVIALLGIANTVLTSVLERQRELATFRAIGASRTQIRHLVLWETSYLGLLGALMGVAAGILLSVLLIEVINRQSFGWTIEFTLPGGLLVEAVALAVIAAVIAGLVPAFWAARQSIVDGLRYE